jgi:glycosyltransferase involved in cell wall biosynthesis
MSISRQSVLHVISGLDVGGAENHLSVLADGLTSKGYEVTIAYLKGSGGLKQEFNDLGCTVRQIGIRYDADPLGFIRLLHHMITNEYDIVHTHLFHADMYGVQAAKLANVPTIISSKHNDPPFWRVQPYAALHNTSLAQTDRVIAISDHVRDYLIENSRAMPELVQTVRYGLPTEKFDSLSETSVRGVRDSFVDTNQKLVGTVARLTEQKNLGSLLAAFRVVNQRVPGSHLVIAGQGEEEQSLISEAEDLGISSNVTFTGFRSDIPQLMSAFDVFALPSIWEGFGVVFLEAMAAGTPTVASDVSAIPEVVAHQETGLLCSPTDVESIADGICSLLLDQELANEMGKAGRERLEQKFTAERMVNEVSRIYQDLSSG